MKFDYTKGQEAKYMVSTYRWNGEDKYYVHSMETAEKLFEELKRDFNEGIISIYDLEKDEILTSSICGEVRSNNEST